MKILAIETSCDESAVCILEAEGNFERDFKYKILGNALISQAPVHAQYGGVFPSLAKREHAKNLVPMLEKALHESKMARVQYTDISAYRDELKTALAREPELFERLTKFLSEHARPEIDCVAVTVGPGLEPALWVGINFARALSRTWNVPIVAVNHMEGHIVITMMNFQTAPVKEHSHILENVRMFTGGILQEIRFPLISLLISGGHTELVLSREWMEYEIIGKTRDDAAGEAFDKVARLLGLQYPGGPEISRLAEQARKSDEVSPHRISLPRPMMHSVEFDFSFAGLKTAVRRIVEKETVTSQETKMEIAQEFEDAVSDVLVGKTLRAVKEHDAQTVIVGGGVSANTHIRNSLAEALKNTGIKLLVPPRELATDNAIMIALAGYFHAIKDEYADHSAMRANGNLKLGSEA